MIYDFDNFINEYAMSPNEEFKQNLKILPDNDIFKLATFTKKGTNNIVYNYNLIKKSIEIATKMINPNKNIGGQQFLLEISMVESMLGTHPKTVRIGENDRGPFQLNSVGFNETKKYKSHPALLKYYKNLKKYGINWLKTSVEMTNTVLFGAIASRMLLLIDTKPIPNDLNGRANYWKTEYNTKAGKGSEEDYIERVKLCINLLQKEGVNISIKGLKIDKTKNIYHFAKQNKHIV
jgi:hypothetical protein